MTSRTEKLVLLAVLAAAFILRVWGLGFGLPFQAHQDEPIVVNHALAYGSGDLNPHFFQIPPLTSYILFLVYAAMFVLGKLAGAWHSAQGFAVAFFRDPAIFYLAGRFFIGVIPGMLCVMLTCRFASMLLSERSCRYAMAVMAFAFLNVVNSHYIYTDMLLVAAVLLAYMAFFRLYDRPSLLNHVIAGACVGLAAAVKYNGAILAVTYLLAHVLGARKDGEKALSFKPAAAFIFAAAVFLAANPFALLDHRGFLGSLLIQSGASWWTGPAHHFTYSLAEGISLPVAVLGAVGLVALATVGARGVIFVSFPAVFYALLVFRSQHFARYVLPLVPFFAIGAAYLVFQAMPHLVRAHWARRAITALAVAALLPTAVRSVKADMIFSSADTRLSAAAWIRENIAPGSKIACDSTVFRPALKQPYSQLTEKAGFLKKQGALEELKSRKLELMEEASDKEDKGYPLYFLFERPEAQGQFLDTVPALSFDLAVLKREGIEYVTVNEQVTNGAKEAFLKELEAGGEMVKEFSPYFDGEFRGSNDTIDATCIPMAGRELFSRRSAGPGLRIYRLK